MYSLKDKISQLLLFVFLLLGNIQFTFSQIIDLDLRKFDDCTNQFRIELWVTKSSLTPIDIQLGISSILINYDPTVLNLENYLPQEFNASTSIQAENANWSDQRWNVDQDFGIFNLVLLKNDGGNNQYVLNENSEYLIGSILFEKQNNPALGNTTIKANLSHTTFFNINEIALALEELPKVTFDPSVYATQDIDNDGVCDAIDNCINAYNPSQLDGDGDGIGDVCDNSFDQDCSLIDVSIVNNSFQISGFNAAHTYIEIYDESWNKLYESGLLLNASSYTSPVFGSNSYIVTLLSFNEIWEEMCNEVFYMEIPITANPCATLGGDTDGDGICDVSDNCVNLFNSDQLDSDGDGIGNVCDDTPNGNGDCNQISVFVVNNSFQITGFNAAHTYIEIYDENWNKLYESGLLLNSNSFASPVFSSGLYIVTILTFDQGWVEKCNEIFYINNTGSSIPCANLGGDSDNDGICDDVDCQPNNSFYPNTPGVPCDDGNANTINDIVTSDGCSCEGQQVVGGCNVSIYTDGCDIFIDGIDETINNIKIFNPGWFGFAWSCNPWNGDLCSESEVISGLSNGLYPVRVYTLDENGNEVCNFTEFININCIGGGISNFVLPEFLGFEVKKIGLQSELTWLVARDINIQKYEVEVSLNGIDFSIIETVNPDQVDAPRSYQTIDYNPKYGVNFYRLKVHRLNGDSYYSKIRRLQFDIDFNDVIVFPNPTNEIININLRDFVGKRGYIEIFNSFGQKQLKKDFLSIPSLPVGIDVRNFIPGVYTVLIKIEEHNQIVKQFVMID